MHITITVELAAAVGKIAHTFKHNDNAALRIEHRDVDPENVWHVTAVMAAGEDVDYRIDDETGLVPREPTIEQLAEELAAVDPKHADWSSGV
jgi:hypothetical protein